VPAITAMGKDQSIEPVSAGAQGRTRG
jgi:hypothetical protein